MISRLSRTAKKRILSMILVAIVFVLIHFITDPVFGDEVGFRKGAVQYDHNYFLYVYARYFTWSSRFILDLLMLWIPSLPAVVWKVLDLGVILLLYWLLAKFSDRHLETALLLCAYPFMHMGSAGWIATTTIYLWPFTAALAAFFLLLHKDAEEKILCSFTYFILVIYAANNEILACLYAVALIIYRYTCREKIKKYRGQLLWIIISLFICILGIINVLVCPGNTARIAKETTKWMPQFQELNIFQRVRICIVSTLQHFTSIPNILFLVFAFLLAWHVWKRAEKNRQKVYALLPLFISVILTIYYFITNIVIHRNVTYLLPEIAIKTGSPEFFDQFVLLVLAVLYLAGVLWALSFLYQRKEEKIQRLGIYIGSLASRFALIFSPTMLASGTRIYFLIYMALIWLEIDLMKKIKNHYIQKIIQCVLIIGIIINLCMVYMMQQKYG
ncbi:MAG: hypothetical protein NC293_03495 [Roseburia sp.]|nr:hypothetical protein [Roseburia sp.]